MAEPSYTEHRVPHGTGQVYARDYAGAEPAFVLMHGFPDNLHIYDRLIPPLSASGRRVVTFDFLGFGDSGKPDGATYGFDQQIGDLEAVIDHLHLGPIVPVAHDSSGIVALNFAMARPGRVASVIMLNSAYAETDAVVWPEMITLFATASLRALATAIAGDPAMFGWLLGWQQQQFTAPLPDALKPGMTEVIGPLVERNFTQQPSAGPAFMQMAAQFSSTQSANAARAAELLALDIPVKLIWGEYDPYITVTVAEQRVGQLKNATLTVLPAGHWLQVDMPDAVAREMLA